MCVSAEALGVLEGGAASMFQNMCIFPQTNRPSRSNRTRLYTLKMMCNPLPHIGGRYPNAQRSGRSGRRCNGTYGLHRPKATLMYHFASLAIASIRSKICITVVIKLFITIISLFSSNLRSVATSTCTVYLSQRCTPPTTYCSSS
jgi:hypothetical protein